MRRPRAKSVVQVPTISPGWASWQNQDAASCPNERSPVPWRGRYLAKCTLAKRGLGLLACLPACLAFVHWELEGRTDVRSTKWAGALPASLPCPAWVRPPVPPMPAQLAGGRATMQQPQPSPHLLPLFKIKLPTLLLLLLSPLPSGSPFSPLPLFTCTQTNFVRLHPHLLVPLPSPPSRSRSFR